MSGNVKVVTRFRPPNALELREGGDIVVDFPQDDDGSRTTVKLKSAPTTGPEANGFNFDKAFPMGTEQKDVFEFGIKETVDDVINGYNGTIFAYGQTGSGKTYTMMGDIFSDTQRGIIPRITGQIFESIMASPPNTEYLVKVSYMEIYMEKIRDLLAPHNDNLQIHEDKAKGVYVKGLSDFYVGGQDDVYEIMRQGGNARAVSSTNMNAESSRSHSIFLITIQQRNVETGTIKNGNLYLVDLAGSEKVGKTGASGQTLEEAKKINKSLSALGMVINALTDGKSSHIPYRDSKLTRILQESLGGNSRTTLIINCSPCSYNLDETISTLRFGVRAKSIKNSARVNAELSPAELKILLKKSKLDNEKFKAYITSLESELKVWRSGEKVPESEWAEIGKAVIGGGGDSTSVSQPSSGGTASQRSSRAMTPAIEGLKELNSRPETPTSLSLDKDEREEFLKRENELSDQIFEKENALKSLENSFKELKEELNFYKEQEERLSNENKDNSKQVSEMKLQLEKVTFEHKESSIHMDILKEQNLDLTNELEELRKSFNSERNLEKEQRDQGKERKKAEKMAKMMADFNAGIVSEKEEQIRETLAKLENLSLTSKDGTGVGAGQLSPEDLNLLKEQLLESQTLVKEHEERIKLTLSENELLNQRREEMENRLFNLESQYDKLLDENLNSQSLKQQGQGGGGVGGEDPSSNNQVIQEFKEKLEQQYSNKREVQLNEISDLKKTIELKSRETANLMASNESLKNANEELKRAFAITAAGIEGGKNLAESAKEMERVRKNMSNQLMEFDTMKKSLMRDLQNRCEKVVELEISLDESKEQYNNIVRSSNTKTQQKKMAFLERNLEQLTNVQKQLVEQNSTLKKEVALAERKLLTRNERIEALTLNVKEAEERLERKSKNFDETIAKFKTKFNSSNDALNNRNLPHGGPNVGIGGNARIAMPLRGGGAQTSASNPLAQGASGPQPAGNSVPLRNPNLGNNQPNSLDSNTAKSRSSWFFSSSSSFK